MPINYTFIEMRKVKPYYFEYKSFAKGRWLGRTLLDVFSSEFRDRSEDYYVSIYAPFFSIWIQWREIDRSFIYIDRM